MKTDLIHSLTDSFEAHAQQTANNGTDLFVLVEK